MSLVLLSGCVSTVAQFEPVPRDSVETTALGAPDGDAPASLDAPEYEMGDGVPRYWPVEDPSRYITSWYGMRNGDMHKGIDIKGRYGAPLMATAPGVVSYVGWMRGYGKVVLVDHENDFTTLYAHLSEILVEKGQVVRTGETIGELGKTGNATGHVVHYEVRLKGKCFDPTYFLPAMDASDLASK